MSVWGSGNFDNSYAVDYLVAIVFEIIERIERCLEQKDSFCRDVYLLTSIDILTTFAQSYGEDVLIALEEQPVSQWKEACLQIYDESSSYETDATFAAERRQVIVETFKKLEHLIQTWIDKKDTLLNS